MTEHPLRVVLIAGRYDGQRDLCWSPERGEDDPPPQIVVGYCSGDGACEQLVDGEVTRCSERHVAWTSLVRLAQALGEPAQYMRLRADDERVEYVHSEVDLKTFFDAASREPVGASTGRRVVWHDQEGAEVASTHV